jgi:hypothetical protein
MPPKRAQPEQLPLTLPEPMEMHLETRDEILQALGDLLRQGTRHRSPRPIGVEAAAVSSEHGEGHE